MINKDFTSMQSSCISSSAVCWVPIYSHLLLKLQFLHISNYLYQHSKNDYKNIRTSEELKKILRFQNGRNCLNFLTTRRKSGRRSFCMVLVLDDKYLMDHHHERKTLV